MKTLVIAIILIFVAIKVAQLIAAIAIPVGIFALVCTCIYGAYQLYLFFYFRSEKFKSIKSSIEKYTNDCNNLNDHIEELREFHSEIESPDYGSSQLIDESIFKFKRNEWDGVVRHSQVHNCSASVCKNANDQPFKYLCKYFNIDSNEESLSKFESTLNNFYAADQGRLLLQKKEEEIVQSIEKSIPPFIPKLSKARLMKSLGFSSIDLSNLHFPVYTFQYVSAGGNSSMRADIQLDLENLEGFVNYLGSLIKFRNSAAGQRALMTPALREEIKARDNYACRICSLSINDERNLLLEIDHIIPISKGGKTTRSNLQTLCWRCNRSKGAKTSSHQSIEIIEPQPEFCKKPERISHTKAQEDDLIFENLYTGSEMSKKDITKTIEKLLAFEQKLNVEISSTSAYIDADEDDDFISISIQGEVSCHQGTIAEDFNIVAAAYDNNGRVVATTEHFISSEDFMGFDTFSMSMDTPTRDISKIKLYPKR
jgi:HNH endonuclease